MHHMPTVAFVIVLSVLASRPACSRADELAERGRDIFKKNQRAVITVQIVMKLKFSVPGLGGQANESKQDLTGTVVDPSGLTVLALSSCEPADMFQNMMAGMSDEETKFKMDTELSDIKLLLDDGTELPADIVLRDKDLDLAFIRPKTRPASPMLALDLSKAATAQILDQVITLNRLGKAAGRAYAVSVERISAVVQKPRLFYVPGSEMTSTTLGSPAFTLEGNVLGVFVTRSVSQKGSGFGMFSFRPEGLTTIILPAGDVLKAAKQAPEAKSGDEQKVEPTEKK
ncbi:MAG: trypsin-like peptidase domain-containing protein [Verrucomicrobia bacterium]|nr:MAG: trypsin-like peptidase domain-containing protein [Verrucomicrobiota bacterium]